MPTTNGADNGPSLRPESSDIFAGTGSEIHLHKLGKKKKAKNGEKVKINDISDESERRKKMMELAKRLSKQIGEQNGRSSKGGKSKDKAKFAKVDGERVTNVVKKKKCKTVVGDEADVATGDNVEDEDNYVLRKLFKKSGVHAALRHDKIVNETAPDHALIEGTVRWSNFDRKDPKMGVFMQSTEATSCGHLL